MPPSPRGATVALSLLLALSLAPVGARPDRSPSSTPRTNAYWAFRKPVQPRVPAARLKAFRGWARNPIDAFILAALEKKGLAASPPTDPLTLLRRVTFDLTGLPPTPEEIAAYRADRSPDAYEKVVRRLLASPRYGERWAQHWLDVTRFAETNGFELDADRPQAWRYRDYVVRALNEDKPFDRFIIEQLAGDEIEPDDHEARVATGFLRAGPQHVVGGNQDLAVNRQEWLTEAVTGVGAAFMGLTIQCARCHNHKFDPIPQSDYYRLQAFFAATDSYEFQRVTDGERAAHEAAVKAHKARLKPITDQIAAIEKPYRERLRNQKQDRLEPEYARALAIPEKQRTPEEQRLAMDAQSMLKIDWDELVALLSPQDRDCRAALRQQMHALELEEPQPLPVAMGVAHVLKPLPKVHVLFGGDPHAPGDEVQPGFPAVLTAGMMDDGRPTMDDGRWTMGDGGRGEQSGPRSRLARWLTGPDHPLTARVIANRLWQHHFGRGIVGTPNDFGRNGERPTHPELLDWLARSLVLHSSTPPLLHSDRRWSLKRLHTLMVCSSTYRQSSAPDPARAKIDPENRLLWRMNRRRLDAEAVRDAVLQAAGTLNLQPGGPPVRVPLEPEVYETIFTEGEPDNLWPVTPDRRQHVRRSLYLLRKRNVRLPMLALFDSPDMMSPCAARGETVHALQSLTLMNSDFMTQQSRQLARRLLAEVPAGTTRRIERLYLFSLGRPPSPPETRATERFLKSQTALIRSRLAQREPVTRLEGLKSNLEPAAVAAWVDLCLATLNLNEFVYIR